MPARTWARETSLDSASSGRIWSFSFTRWESKSDRRACALAAARTGVGAFRMASTSSMRPRVLGKHGVDQQSSAWILASLGIHALLLSKRMRDQLGVAPAD